MQARAKLRDYAVPQAERRLGFSVARAQLTTDALAQTPGGAGCSFGGALLAEIGNALVIRAERPKPA